MFWYFIGVSGSQEKKMNTSFAKSLLLFALIKLLFIVILVESRRASQVTCGSVFKLVNNAFKIRLHSHDIKYGSGSGQQSVTGTDVTDDVNSNWVAKGTNKFPCTRG